MQRHIETIEAKQLHRLLEIYNTLGITGDLSGLFEIVIGGITELVNSEYAAILLLDQITGALFLAADSDPSSSENEVAIFENSFARRIIESKQPLIINETNAIEDSEFTLASSWSEAIKNFLGVPLISNGRVIGALEIVNKRDPVGYSDQDTYVLQILAAQTALAIENARLFQQTDLIADFMHELKTPLMALTAASELLARENLAQRQVELVDMMQAETMRLSKMARDFLDLARLESGRAKIAQEPVDLLSLLQDVVRSQQPQASARNIKISTDIPGEFPFIIGDFARLKRAFLNLTNNAIKYNVEEGRVVLSLKIANQEAVITISDTGPGIGEANLPHLFDRFYRLPDNEGFTEGTGLGLSIAARILQEHGGRIEVESELGKGSSFHSYLPLQAIQDGP